MKDEICSNCNAIMEPQEQAYVFNGTIVCEECDNELRNGSGLNLVGLPDSPSNSPDRPLTSEFSENSTDEKSREMIGLNDTEVVASTQTAERVEPNPNDVQTNAKYKGVRGWLLFFCLILTVFSPLGNVIIYVATFDKVTSYFEQFPGLKTPFIIETTLTIGLMAFSVFAGICLWQIRPNAVSIAKTYLGVFLGVAILEIFLPLTGSLPPEVWGPVVKEGFRQTFAQYIFYWTWSSYLHKSRRVAATYSDRCPQFSL